MLWERGGSIHFLCCGATLRGTQPSSGPAAGADPPPAMHPAAHQVSALDDITGARSSQARQLKVIRVAGNDVSEACGAPVAILGSGPELNLRVHYSASTWKRSRAVPAVHAEA